MSETVDRVADAIQAASVLGEVQAKRAALAALAVMPAADWRPMDTWDCPNGKVVLFFSVTDRIDGRVTNWKMATGSYDSQGENLEWDGRRLAPYEVQPTHWQPLPPPPEETPDV